MSGIRVQKVRVCAVALGLHGASLVSCFGGDQGIRGYWVEQSSNATNVLEFFEDQTFRIADGSGSEPQGEWRSLEDGRVKMTLRIGDRPEVRMGRVADAKLVVDGATGEAVFAKWPAEKAEAFLKVRREAGRRRTTVAMIEALSTAVLLFEVDVGRYPRSLDELLKRPGGNDGTKWNGPYVSGKLGLRDPWGRVLEYMAPGHHNVKSFDLWSRGADEEKSGDDVVNWTN